MKIFRDLKAVDVSMSVCAYMGVYVHLTKTLQTALAVRAFNWTERWFINPLGRALWKSCRLFSWLFNTALISPTTQKGEHTSLPLLFSRKVISSCLVLLSSLDTDFASHLTSEQCHRYSLLLFI